MIANCKIIRIYNVLVLVFKVEMEVLIKLLSDHHR